MKAECLILSPVTLQVNVTRNLSSSWYNDHPDIEISGKLCNFSVSVSYYSGYFFIVEEHSCSMWLNLRSRN